MSYSYGEYKDKDGNVALLQSDALSRGKYERKGLTYVGPAKTVPGLEPANEEWIKAEGWVKDKEGKVTLSEDEVLKKISGKWLEEDALAERVAIRNTMDEHGSFDYLKAGLPEAEEAATKPAKSTKTNHATAAPTTTTPDGAAGAPGTATAPRAKPSTS